jgi:hypothetical protein
VIDPFFFDPSTEAGSFELIPPGDYTAQIVEAEIRQPQSGDGNMLKLTWRISQGEHEGRQVWETLCFQHSNPQTETIARRRLKDICTALNITQHVDDPGIFTFKPAAVRIGIKVDKTGRFDDANTIKRVRALDGQVKAEAAKAEPTAPAAPKAKHESGLGAAPWKRGA